MPLPPQTAILTCALTGVLTDPTAHPVPVTPEQMANEAKRAFNAGASVMHIHFRDQRPGRGHLPTWDPNIAHDITQAIRDACPGVLINMSTGVIGDDTSGPLACLERTRPELAACNAGTLNYLKTRADGRWAWPPMVFDNPVEKVQRMCAAMVAGGTVPEFECFDVGILRSVSLYRENGWAPPLPQTNLVMGVASGMPADPRLLEVILPYVTPGALWQATVIGREEVWALHARAAQLGGQLRVGVEDTFYLPDGSRCRGNGDLVEALAAVARAVGREPASPAEARAAILGARAGG